MSDTPSKYNTVQVCLHWVTALVIIFMLIMGHFALAPTPNDDPIKITALKGHMIIGVIILLLTIVRIVWRRKSAQPPHATTGNALLDKAGVFAHYALNILTFLVAASGIGIAIQAGLPDIVFGGQGQLPETLAIYPPRIAHTILTKLLVLLVVAHVFGGIYHQFILKDGLFKRMSFKKAE